MAERAYVAFLRHGAYHQRKGVPSARQPWPLTDEGKAQARAGANLLAGMIAEHGLRLSPVVHASHQLRAWQTAQELAARLDAVLPTADTHPVRLHQAMRYACEGGKRLRALLVYATARCLGLPLERADASACAVELIHAYSLVHDDLPAMDDDDLRRGRPTVHRQYDEATAILVGDALGTLAFEVLAADDTVAAAIRGHAGIALGNVLGSNIYNLLLIGGVTMAISGRSIPARLLFPAWPVCVATAILLVLVCWGMKKFGRFPALLLLLAFAANTALAFR